MANESSRPESSPASDNFKERVAAARSGDQEELNRLLEECRPYLLMIANQEMDSQLGAKAGASDMVQNAMVSAFRCMDDFEGQTDESWRAWLRTILLNDVKQERRKFRAARRDMHRERALDADRESPNRAPSQIAGPAATPSSAAVQNERSMQLAEAMEQLSPEDRLVLQLRAQKVSYAEIGEQIDRSAEAVRKVWSRACLRLKKMMDTAGE